MEHRFPCRPDFNDLGVTFQHVLAIEIAAAIKEDLQAAVKAVNQISVPLIFREHTAQAVAFPVPLLEKVGSADRECSGIKSHSTGAGKSIHANESQCEHQDDWNDPVDSDIDGAQAVGIIQETAEGRPRSRLARQSGNRKR